MSGRVVDSNGSPVEGAMVSVGRVIFGDGTSAKASGGSRNSMARSTKTTQTGENGGFEVFGAKLGDLNVVADHETIGRSLPMSVQMSIESLVSLELVLLKTGSLQGVIRKLGTPRSGVVLTAASTKVTGVTFNVASGNDGSYRFDRLAPDTYRVSAVAGGNLMSGMRLVSELVTVNFDQTANLDLELEEGGTKLIVNLDASAELNFAMLRIVSGAFSVQSARELDAIIGQGRGFEGRGMSIRGQPVWVEGMQPGELPCVRVPIRQRCKAWPQSWPIPSRRVTTCESFASE